MIKALYIKIQSSGQQHIFKLPPPFFWRKSNKNTRSIRYYYGIIYIACGANALLILQK